MDSLLLNIYKLARCIWMLIRDIKNEKKKDSQYFKIEELKYIESQPLGGD